MKEYKVLIEVVEDDGENIIEVTGCNTVDVFNNEEDAIKRMEEIIKSSQRNKN